MSVEKPEFGEVFEFKHSSTQIRIVYLRPSRLQGLLGWIGASLFDPIVPNLPIGERIDLNRDNWRSLDNDD